MADTLNVLELLGTSTGGIRKHVAQLTDHLEERGWTVTVAGPEGVMEGAGRLDAVVGVPFGLAPDELWRARRSLAAVVADRRPAVIHAHGLKAGWVAASLRRRPPVVVSVHNLVLPEVAGRSYRVLRRLETMLPARVEAVVAISDEVARRFTGVAGAGRITVVPPIGPSPEVRRSASEVRAELGVGPDEHLLVTAARLNPQKGIDILLEALALLRGQVAGVRSVVFGEGAARDSLLARAEELGLGDVVHLAGSRPSVADELAAADVVVVPSRWESGPLVVFEALHLGRPVVTTAVGAAPRVVVDGVTGRLVPVGDAPALARAIGSMLEDPASAGRMAAAGRELAKERYGPDALVDGVEAVYRRVAGAR